jgi:hypothetical protein
MGFKLFNSGDMNAIMNHAEQRASDPLNVDPKTKEQAAGLADTVANVWCKEEDGYDDIDRQAYRAAWYHTTRTKKGW